MTLRPHKAENIGVAHGKWGERVATDYLRCHGYEIIERNSRPCERDNRLEIDIIAWDRPRDTMVFIEVKQHASFSQYAHRLRSITRQKRKNLLRACNAWRRINRWLGAIRFDVVEIHGVPENGSPVIDHIRNVRLFAMPDRFVHWEQS